MSNQYISHGVLVERDVETPPPSPPAAAPSPKSRASPSPPRTQRNVRTIQDYQQPEPNRTSFFPTSLPPRPGQQSWRDRNCPNVRTCWSFSWSAYSLYTSDKAELARRICMCTVLGVRTAVSIAMTIFDARRGDVGRMIVSIIMGVLGFFFIAWCLACIGEARDKRKVLGTMVGRWHWDILLLILAVIHALILAGVFLLITPAAVSSTWYAMWLLIFAAAWVTRWPPDQLDSQV